MTILRRRLAAWAVAIVGAAAVVAGNAAPVEAGSAYGCSYPNVCFYKTAADWNRRVPTAAYRDVTSYYQTIGSRSSGAYAVVNTRNDDMAYVKMVGGSVLCVFPHGFALNLPLHSGIASGIKISYRDNYCTGNP